MGSIKKRGIKNKIEINFFYRGIRRFEQTDYHCKTGKTRCECRDCKSAHALIAEIERKIHEGTFKYSEYFPDSKALQSLPLTDVSENVGFTVYATQWLNNKENSLAPSTYTTYNGIINIFCNYFKNIPISSIKTTTVQTFIHDYNVAPKTMSNMIGMLYGVFKTAVADDIITKNPCAFVSKPKVRSNQIDPFEHDEMELILSWMDEHHPHMTAFFAIAFYTGMRTGEIMALKWGT